MNSVVSNGSFKKTFSRVGLATLLSVGIVNSAEEAEKSYQIGLAYRDGKEGGYAPKSTEAWAAASSYFLPLAQLGKANAEYNYGQSFFEQGRAELDKGNFIKASCFYDVAFDWFNKAASHPSSPAIRSIILAAKNALKIINDGYEDINVREAEAFKAKKSPPQEKIKTEEELARISCHKATEEANRARDVFQQATEDEIAARKVLEQSVAEEEIGWEALEKANQAYKVADKKDMNSYTQFVRARQALAQKSGKIYPAEKEKVRTQQAFDEINARETVALQNLLEQAKKKETAARQAVDQAHQKEANTRRVLEQLQQREGQSSQNLTGKNKRWRRRKVTISVPQANTNVQQEFLAAQSAFNHAHESEQAVEQQLEQLMKKEEELHQVIEVKAAQIPLLQQGVDETKAKELEALRALVKAYETAQTHEAPKKAEEVTRPLAEKPLPKQQRHKEAQPQRTILKRPTQDRLESTPHLSTLQVLDTQTNLPLAFLESGETYVVEPGFKNDNPFGFAAMLSQMPSEGQSSHLCGKGVQLLKSFFNDDACVDARTQICQLIATDMQDLCSKEEARFYRRLPQAQKSAEAYRIEATKSMEELEKLVWLYEEELRASLGKVTKYPRGLNDLLKQIDQELAENLPFPEKSLELKKKLEDTLAKLDAVDLGHKGSNWKDTPGIVEAFIHTFVAKPDQYDRLSVHEQTISLGVMKALAFAVGANLEIYEKKEGLFPFPVITLSHKYKCKMGAEVLTIRVLYHHHQFNPLILKDSSQEVQTTITKPVHVVQKSETKSPSSERGSDSVDSEIESKIQKSWRHVATSSAQSPTQSTLTPVNSKPQPTVTMSNRSQYQGSKTSSNQGRGYGKSHNRRGK